MNCILDALPADDLDRLAPVMRRQQFGAGVVLHEAGTRLDQVHFPIDAVVSHSAGHDDGLPVETGTVGREGIVSAVALFGDGIAFERAVVQVPGTMVMLPANAVGYLLSEDPRFRALVGAYLQAYTAQTAQTVVCSASHPSEARLARWLLMCLDRTADLAPLPLGGRLLAEKLGIGRPAATVVAGRLQTAGLIRVEREVIHVLDRSGLEDASCDCYRRVRTTFERLFPQSYR